MRWTLVWMLACADPVADPPVDPIGDTEVLETDDTEISTWRSELYPDDWTPDFTTADGRFLHDVSYAGYRGGEELPELAEGVGVPEADPTGETDSTAAIQAVLDVATGPVELGEGLFRIEGELIVSRSGVVLVGQGPERTRLHFTRDVGNTDGAGLTFRGGSRPDEGWLLEADAGSRSTEVRATTPLEVGDAVVVGAVISEAFRAEHGADWPFAGDGFKPFFRRTVVAVDGDRIELDIPLRYPLLTRDQAEIRRDDGYLTEVGLQSVGISSAIDPDAALAFDRHHAVRFDRVAHGWMQDVRSFATVGEGHLQSGGVLVVRSRHLTIADCEMGRPQHRGEGGNGYLYEVSRSNEILIRDSIAREGRHNFIVNWDFSTNGTVFLRTLSEGGRAENGPVTITGLSEFHHALAMANLIDDSVAHDGWQSKNRRSFSSGAGHAGTHNVFWNTQGTGELWSMQYERGYVIGTAPELTVHTALDTFDLTFGALGTEPEDHAEGIGLGEFLEPRSLYEDQRRRRLQR